MSTLQAIILAIVEGLTEFLPVSSTGHMVITSSVMGIASDDFVKLFTVCIQLGAILSVVVLYFKRFVKSLDFYWKLLVAFIPAAILGKLFSDAIDDLLENPLGVGISLLVGGVILLFVDKWFPEASGLTAKSKNIDDTDKMSYLTSLKVGFFQCIALIPGVSRSGATIVGGMASGLTRKAAAEFSFFLAVPTMFAATVYKLYKYCKVSGVPSSDQVQLLAIGNLFAFVVGILAIKSFIGFLNKHGFYWFGWYRIIIGSVIIIMVLAGSKMAVL